MSAMSSLSLPSQFPVMSQIHLAWSVLLPSHHLLFEPRLLIQGLCVPGGTLLHTLWLSTALLRPPSIFLRCKIRTECCPFRKFKIREKMTAFPKFVHFLTYPGPISPLGQPSRERNAARFRNSTSAQISCQFVFCSTFRCFRAPFPPRIVFEGTECCPFQKTIFLGNIISFQFLMPFVTFLDPAPPPWIVSEGTECCRIQKNTFWLSARMFRFLMQFLAFPGPISPLGLSPRERNAAGFKIAHFARITQFSVMW